MTPLISSSVSASPSSGSSSMATPSKAHPPAAGAQHAQDSLQMSPGSSSPVTTTFPEAAAAASAPDATSASATNKQPSLSTNQQPLEEKHPAAAAAASTTTTTTKNSGPTTTHAYHWGSHYFWSPTNSYCCTSNTTTSNTKRRVLYGRALFVLLLGCVAAILGIVAHKLLTSAEQRLGDQQFDSIAHRAAREAYAVPHRREWAGMAMAAAISEVHPNATEYPFVPVLGFERLARGLLSATSGVDMGYAPLVWRDQREDFEDFAYNVYQDELNWPNTTAVNPNFGKGIWANDVTSTEPPPHNRYFFDPKYNQTWNTSYKDLLTPIFRTDEGVHPVLMFDPHSTYARGHPIDVMYACAEERRLYLESLSPEEAEQALEELEGRESHCGVITDMIQVVKHNGRHGMAMLRPVFPRNDPTIMVGLISTLMLVDETLENAFGDDVTGIDAVFETDTKAVTYTIVNGKSQFVGDGDLHDPHYDQYKHSILLVDDQMHAVHTDPPPYTLHLYPNANFYKIYETNNPCVATIGSVCIIAITSLCFFLYDFLVRREFHAKQDLLQARRQFMRFVSHEVRTPLNSICMGLELVQAELVRSMGYTSVASATQDQNLLLHNNNSSSNNSVMKGSADELSPSDSKNNSNNKQQREWDWFILTQEIQSNAQGAIDILNDLLNYDKIEQGTLQLEERIVPVWGLLNKAMMEFKLPAASKQIDLGVSYGTQDCNVETSQQLPETAQEIKLIGDTIRITQVLRNLMSNALKFTSEGGMVHVKTIFLSHEDDDSSESRSIIEKQSNKFKRQSKTVPSNDAHNKGMVTLQSAGSIQIIVSDTGAGMSKDQLARLFSDGVQFNANQLQAGQGSGLGLFIAKGIVEQHGGTLAASSEGLGQGTSFTVTLPVWELPNETSSLSEKESCGGGDTPSLALMSNERHSSVEMPGSNTDTNATSSSSDNPTTTNRSLRVLVVDDVPSNRKLLCRLLENAGHKCEGVSGGQEAVDSVVESIEENNPYDSVMMDYEMPGLDGPSAAKQIRKFGSDVFIVGVTGNVLPEDVAYFKTCGANEVLSKPIKLSDIECTWMEYGIYNKV